MTAQELLELIDPEAAAELEAEADDAVGDEAAVDETSDDSGVEEIELEDFGLEQLPDFTLPEDDRRRPGRGCCRVGVSPSATCSVLPS